MAKFFRLYVDGDREESNKLRLRGDKTTHRKLIAGNQKLGNQKMGDWHCGLCLLNDTTLHSGQVRGIGDGDHQHEQGGEAVGFMVSIITGKVAGQTLIQSCLANRTTEPLQSNSTHTDELSRGVTQGREATHKKRS